MRRAALLLPAIAGTLLAVAQTPPIPKTFDDRELASLEVPLAQRSASPVQLPSEAYYSLPVAPIYQSYLVYPPDKEPPGYLDWLRLQEPQLVFDARTLKADDDWIRAGELVFDKPTAFRPLDAATDVRNPEWYAKTGMPLLRDGSVPLMRYVVREKGKIEIGEFSCAACHTRVMPEGRAIKGAQGNLPFERAVAWNTRASRDIPNGPDRLTIARIIERLLFDAPWIPSDSWRPERLDLEEIASMHEAIPPGVLARHGTNPMFPAKIPDLIGIQQRRYLDATGLVQHRTIGDLMRYAALNQGADFVSRYGNFSPIDVLGGNLPPGTEVARYSDEQLYALAHYIYSLQPPKNPNPFDAEAERGQKVFQKEGCASCHTPPLYTNNKLTIASGFKPSPQDLNELDILPVSIGTDPALALKTRRGTGYYKVPSLKGVWYRGPFEHSGSVATLEDWFDPKRLRADYTPTGFKGYGVKSRAVKGHEFGLKLTEKERKALIAFLKTL